MTTLHEWALNAPYQKKLQELLQDPVLQAALRVLENSNLPSPATQPSTLESLALLHQFQAGFHAGIRALKNLPLMTNERLSMIERAAALEASGPWSHAAASIPESTPQP